MSPEEVIQRRVARELKPHTLVNLGIGLPTGVAHYIDPLAGILFQSENGIVGMGSRPPEGMEDLGLTDAGGRFITAVPGAATVDSTLSFGLIRGGHLDATVLGALEVDEDGLLANWVVPGKMVPGMGGAMDLVTGARKVLIAMQHTAKGKPKIVPRCTLPLTSTRRVSLIITELAVIEPTDEGLMLRERAPGVSVDDILKATTARLIVTEAIPEMVLH
jgi:acetate CoA/acetoacetate CoA-transferase beta subunit